LTRIQREGDFLKLEFEEIFSIWWTYFRWSYFYDAGSKDARKYISKFKVLIKTCRKIPQDILATIKLPKFDMDPHICTVRECLIEERIGVAFGDPIYAKRSSTV